MGIFNKKDDDYKKITDENEKMLLRKEELDIKKDRVRTGEVEVSKEIIDENRSVDVPVSHEEIVIERNAIDNEPTDRPIRAEDSIHIPVSREKVEVGKHTVITGEVAVKKRAVDDIHHVDENLKHEEIRVHKDGDPNIVDSNIKG